MKKCGLWVFVAVCGLLAEMCHATIIQNPGFETGDLTGWDGRPPENMKVVSGLASEGTHYLTADIQWTYYDPGWEAPSWNWYAGCWQMVAIPPGADRLSVDVRTVGLGFEIGDLGQWFIGISGVNPNGSEIFVNIMQNALEITQTSNGFVRYTVDISAASSFASVGISIVGQGCISDEVIPVVLDHKPDVSIEFSVDNFQVIPEPSSLLIIGIGTLFLRRRPANDSKSRTK